MKKLLLLFLVLGTGCQKVPAGTVGVKVYLLGRSKGVDHEVLGPGRYYVGYNEEIFLFPTYKQTHSWMHDESITFQTKEGLTVNTDVGITYSIAPDNVSKVFQSYRRGLEEITDTFLHNNVRDAFNAIASSMDIEAVYGSGKEKMLEAVEAKVAQEVSAVGITVEKIYLVGGLRLPQNVVASIDAKIQATQTAIMRENELREAEAAAKKTIAAAQGQATSYMLSAKAEADGTLLKAKAEAESNQIVSRSLTKELIEYHRVQRWDGAYPKYTGAGSAFFNFKTDQ